MVFTNCGLLGDMFLCLPVLSWYYKTHGEKVTFALATHFPYSRDAEELLSMQECIDKVVYFDYVPENYDMGAQPYHINRDVFGEDVISLGFRSWPDKYIPEYYAEEYGLGVDYDFKLNYGEPNPMLKEWVLKVDKYEEPKLNNVAGADLPASNGMVKNLQLAACAKEIITFTTGFSIMATLARIPVTIYQSQSLIEHHKKYFVINGGIKEVYI